MSQVFISHSSKDRRFVEGELIPLLRGRGIETWYATDDIPSGSLFEHEIKQGLESSDWMIVVLTPAAAESKWVKREVNWWLEKYNDRLIPVVVGECQAETIHFSLPQFNYVDFRGSDLHTARAKLVSTFGLPDSTVATDLPPPLEPAKADLRKSPVMSPRLPFHCGQWVPPELFVGRERELNLARDFINVRQNFLVVGYPRAGKTSFLKKLIADLNHSEARRNLACYMSLDGMTTVDLPKFIEHTLICVVAEIGRVVFKCPYWQLRSSNPKLIPQQLRDDELFDHFLSVFQCVREVAGGTAESPRSTLAEREFAELTDALTSIAVKRGFDRIVMIYDEANRLPRDISRPVLNSIGEALSQTGLIGAYAASPELKTHFDDMPGLVNRHIELGAFRSRDDLSRLLARYVFDDIQRVTDLPVAAEALERLWDVSRGRPYQIQLIADQSFAIAVDESADSIEADHISRGFANAKLDKPSAFES